MNIKVAVVKLKLNPVGRRP